MSKRKHTENQFVTDDCDEQVLIQEILHYFNIWKLKINIQFQAKSYIFLKRLIFEIQRWVQKMQKNYLWNSNIIYQIGKLTLWISNCIL